MHNFRENFYKEFYNEREAQNEENLDEARRKAPEFCQRCNRLKAGKNYDQFNRPYIIPACDKFPDGFSRDMKFSDCLENMPSICHECQFNVDCHFTSGRPMLDINAISNCEINNESRIAMTNLVINRVLFE